jgi:hypothetical protein
MGTADAASVGKLRGFVSHDVRSEKDEIIVDQQQAARKLSSTNPTTCSRLHSFTTLERD